MDAPLLIYSLSQLFLRALFTAERYRLPALWQRLAQPLSKGHGLGLHMAVGGHATHTTTAAAAPGRTGIELVFYRRLKTR